MPNFNVEIPSETACPSCGELVSLEISQCPGCEANMHRLPFDEFFSLLERLRLMDARYGGLVVGRDGPEDDIPMYQFQGSAVFSLAGLMQGGEYILSQAATIKHYDELIALNGDAEETKPGQQFPPASSVINTNFMPQFGGLWISKHQFVVNRYASLKHFARLDQMNREANYELALLDQEGLGPATSPQAAALL